MNRFSELISQGVAAFNHTPVAPSIPIPCPICRSYNNIFSIATDTHMSCLDNGKKIITGHMVGDTKKFDQFVWASRFAGVDFHTAGYLSFADWMGKHGLVGHYETINGDNCYILEEGDFDDRYVIPKPTRTISFTTENSLIPQPGRLLTKDNSFDSIKECIKHTYTETAQAMNESKYVYGDKWQVVNLSDNTHIVGIVNGVAYKI